MKNPSFLDDLSTIVIGIPLSSVSKKGDVLSTVSRKLDLLDDVIDLLDVDFARLDQSDQTPCQQQLTRGLPIILDTTSHADPGSLRRCNP